MLQTRLKASSLTNLTDARYFAAREATWLGFNLDAGSEAYVDPTQVLAIREWVDSVLIVGEFGLQSASEIREYADFLRLDAVQVSPFTPPEVLIELRDLILIRELVFETPPSAHDIREALQPYAGLCAWFLLDFEKNRLPMSALPPEMPELCREFPLLLACDWTPAQLRQALEVWQPAGIALRGGDEEKVGYKSFDELDELLDVLEEA
jgi:phosphoribosylanthranilate isomerase